MVIFRRGKYSTLISFLISVLLLLSLLQLTLLQTASALTNYTIYLNNLDSDDYYAKIIVKGGGFLEPVVIGSNIMNKTIHLMVDGPPLSARLILIKKYPSLGKNEGNFVFGTFRDQFIRTMKKFSAGCLKIFFTNLLQCS